MNFGDCVTLGRSGIESSRIGIGAGYGPPQDACERAYHEHGINFFYPSLPQRGPMKRAIRNLAGQHRDDLVLCLQSYDHFGFFLRFTFERQLRSLGIDYADILLLGWFNRKPPARILDTAVALKDEGKARAIAMSGHNRPTFAKLAAEPDLPIDIFMMRYNVAHRGAESDIFPHLPEENRPGTIAYTATCWGKLLNPKKMPPEEPPMTAADCYRFALSSPHIDMSLCGPANAEQLEHAASVLTQGPLSEEELDRFRRIGDYVHG